MSDGSASLPAETFVAMNRFTVIEGQEAAFEACAPSPRILKVVLKKLQAPFSYLMGEFVSCVEAKMASFNRKIPQNVLFYVDILDRGGAWWRPSPPRRSSLCYLKGVMLSYG